MGAVLWYHVDFICRCRIVDDDFFVPLAPRIAVFFFRSSISNWMEEHERRNEAVKEEQTTARKRDWVEKARKKTAAWIHWNDNCLAVFFLHSIILITQQLLNLNGVFIVSFEHISFNFHLIGVQNILQINNNVATADEQSRKNKNKSMLKWMGMRLEWKDKEKKVSWIKSSHRIKKHGH